MKNVDDNIPALSVLDEKAEDGQDGVLIRSLDDMLQRIQDNKKVCLTMFGFKRASLREHCYSKELLK